MYVYMFTKNATTNEYQVLQYHELLSCRPRRIHVVGCYVVSRARYGSTTASRSSGIRGLETLPLIGSGVRSG